MPPGRTCSLASSSVRSQISWAMGLRDSSRMWPTRPTARAITPRPRQIRQSKPISQQIAPMAPVALIGRSPPYVRLASAVAIWLGPLLAVVVHHAEAVVAAMLLRGNGRCEKLMTGGRLVGLRFLNPNRLWIGRERLAQPLERDGITAFTDHWESLPLFATERALPAATQEEIRAGRLRNDHA